MVYHASVFDMTAIVKRDWIRAVLHNNYAIVKLNEVQSNVYICEQITKTFLTSTSDYTDQASNNLKTQFLYEKTQYVKNVWSLQEPNFENTLFLS